MSKDAKPLGSTLTLRWTDYSSENLNVRIANLRKADQYLPLDNVTNLIQFLRGVGGRATFMLPAYYALSGARVFKEKKDIPYWMRVRALNAENSCLQTISLSCRSVFDDSRKGLTGKFFALASDETLALVAEYWANMNGRQTENASRALRLLRDLFRVCAQPRKHLLSEPSLLARRVGLLKHHADRHAAHISLEPFLFNLTDLTHVVAAVTVIGAIICEFDNKNGETYFDMLDEASWSASQYTFPGVLPTRLFYEFNVLEQGRLYYKSDAVNGLDMLLNQLPAALGCWDSDAEL